MSFELPPRYVRDEDTAKLAMNTKESYELLKELFLGNDFFEQDKAAHDLKMLKIIDLI